MGVATTGVAKGLSAESITGVAKGFACCEEVPSAEEEVAFLEPSMANGENCQCMDISRPDQGVKRATRLGYVQISL